MQAVQTGLQRRQTDLQAEQTALHRQQEEREGERDQVAKAREQAAQRSRLTTEFYRSDKGWYTLTVQNRGPSDAVNVRVLLDKKPIEEHDAWEDDQGRFPDTIAGLVEIGPYMLSATFRSSPPWQLRIEWLDEIDGSTYHLEKILPVV